MNREELKSLQTPLKELYKTDPSKAFVTLKVSGYLGGGVTCSVQTGKTLAEAGLHPAAGGDGTFACSGDMLLEALCACAGVTMNAVAVAIGVNIRSGNVYAEGDLDFRGTMAVSKEVPVGFQNIRLRFELDTDDDDEKLSNLLRLTERYCVVFQTLKTAPSFDISVIKK